MCGDQVTFFFKMKKGKIAKISFIGKGCAISIASASILSGVILNKPVSSLSKITSQDIFKLLGGPISGARLKCAFLPLEAFRKIKIQNVKFRSAVQK